MTRTADADFEHFVRAQSTRLLRFAEMLCGDRHTAEDLVQQALMRSYPKWHRLDGDPLRYVRRVLVNRFLSASRRHWSNEVPSDPVDNDWDHREVADFSAEVQTREAVLAALAGLTVKERAVVALRYSQDLSEAETAELLGMAAGTVKSTASRALAKLRLAPDLIDTTVGGRA
jgi:RNA polymerase sigma-70 factor (sigma-E family)